MPTQKFFIIEFDAEPVRHAQNSGQTQLDLARDVGVGLSTLCLGTVVA